MVLATILLKGETSYRNVLGLSKNQILEDYPDTRHCSFVCEKIELSPSIEEVAFLSTKNEIHDA